MKKILVPAFLLAFSICAIFLLWQVRIFLLRKAQNALVGESASSGFGIHYRIRSRSASDAFMVGLISYRGVPLLSKAAKYGQGDFEGRQIEALLVITTPQKLTLAFSGTFNSGL